MVTLLIFNVIFPVVVSIFLAINSGTNATKASVDDQRNAVYKELVAAMGNDECNLAAVTSVDSA